MKKHYHAILLLSFALAAAPLTHAATFTDNFQRAATTGQDKNSDPNAISTSYTILTGKWNISDTGTAGRIPNYLAAAQDGTEPALMYLNAFQVLRNDSNQFSVSMDVWNGGYGSNNRWQGMVFNLQDANNYYIFEYEVRSANSGVVRLGIVIDGSYTQLIAQSAVDLDRSIYYRMTVTADSTTISASLYSGMTELVSLSSTNTQLLNGYAGFIRKSTASTAFDNFEVITIPESSTVMLTLGIAASAIVYVRRSRSKRVATLS